MILASYMTTACTLKAAILSVQLPFFSFGNGFLKSYTVLYHDDLCSVLHEAHRRS